MPAPSPTGAGSVFAGAVSVALALTEKGELAADPEIDLIGIPERGRDGALMVEHRL